VTVITKIEWADSTFNPWEGCQKVGPGCDHCYAETRNARFAGGTAVNWGPGAPRRRTSAANWNEPRRWQAQAAAFFEQHGRRRRVFCASLADVFDNAVDPKWREDLFDLILATPDLDWLLLTKRIGNVPNMLPVPFSFDKCYPNVWIGATITSQAEADRDLPKLLQLDAKVRFLSIEPMLGAIDLDCPNVDWAQYPEGGGIRGDRIVIDWVICGGESGPDARPIHPDWARELRDQCAGAGIPFLFKQWGEFAPNSRSFMEVEFSERKLTMVPYSEARPYPAAAMDRVGKKAAGRQLDGVEHNGFPEVRHA
jgi:protein gp37